MIASVLFHPQPESTRCRTRITDLDPVVLDVAQRVLVKQPCNQKGIAERRAQFLGDGISSTSVLLTKQLRSAMIWTMPRANGWPKANAMRADLFGGGQHLDRQGEIGGAGNFLDFLAPRMLGPRSTGRFWASRAAADCLSHRLKLESLWRNLANERADDRADGLCSRVLHL
ncbi:MAG: hypothetical protein R3E58_19895 [Phycisphaerae bacterium]